MLCRSRMKHRRMQRRRCLESKEREDKKMDIITINGVEYVKKEDVKAYDYEMAQKLDDMSYCIIRTYSAGVFAGYLKKRIGKEVLLVKARRIWYWDGACSLSQLAFEGTKNPEKCKFAVELPEVILTETIEIIPCTECARNSIQGVQEWKV